jgi:flagellar FliL protein
MAEAVAGEGKGKKKRGKLVLIAVPLVLVLAGTGLWFTGILPHLLGHAPEQHAKNEAPQPVFVDLPEIVANLDSSARQPAFIKLKARLELAKPEDQAVIAAAMPRILDLFQTYLRETRPEELRGSAGTYRLREELISRASLAASPARVTDVLFTQVLVQ